MLNAKISKNYMHVPHVYTNNTFLQQVIYFMALTDSGLHNEISNHVKQLIYQERCFFVLSQAWDNETILSSHEELNLRPSDLHSNALPLSTDSTVSEVYYEVQMTRVLHTARISNVDSRMFFQIEIVEMVTFEFSKELRKMFFHLVTSVGQRRNSESPRGEGFYF